MKLKFSIAAVLTFVFVSILGIWLLGSAFGLFGNFLSWDARQAGWGWKFVMVLFLAGCAYQMIQIGRSVIEARTGSLAVVWLLLGLAIVSATGFKGTAGDIKQRVTYMNLDGKVVDKDLLYNCYEEFYQFKQNPALKEYVETYGELPGVNNYAFNIIEGKTPLSTAPRADENFKWHTGAYQQKRIPKNCGK